MDRKFIISGGGTGGHIFPALSIANEIRKKEPDARILFVGALGRMEMEKIPAAGYPIIGLPVEGIQRRFDFHNLVVLYKLIISLFESRKILKSFKPNVVIGVGGFASGPLLIMATWSKIPTVIQEQNSYAGITNRFLARKASLICVAYEGMEKYFPVDKLVLTGNPVREDIINPNLEKSKAYEYFNIQGNKPVILILGGSQGARSINDCLLQQADRISNENVNLLWQTGKLYYNLIKEELDRKRLINITYLEFINRMDLAYCIADVIISRAGAGTISELCLVGKPVILVPSPNVAENHQTKNANVLLNKNAALVIPDNEAPKKLVEEALQLVKNETLKQTLGMNCKKVAVSDSTSRIVNEILKLIQDK
jgi:UDP-N-acetylglucosamine--N-acetylmuramyl-(pentapeptide) pyrophosphoryl-undecaprenol N-acetylglucosamine transferase